MNKVAIYVLLLISTILNDTECKKSVLKRFLSVGIGASLMTTPIYNTHMIPVANADARLNAPTAAGTRVNSDPESLLRYGLPFNDKDIRSIQSSIESVKSNLKTRRPGFAVSDLTNAKKLIKSNSAKIIKKFPEVNRAEGQKSLEKLEELISPVEDAINTQQASGSGSVQERAGLDDAFAAQDNLAKQLTVVEEYLIPPGFKRTIPEEYKDLPALQGRATIQFVIVKPDGSKYDIEGTLYDNAKLTMTVDGYNAPLTAGNFVDLVSKGYYDNKKITRSDGFVVQTGDANPDGDIHGYVPSGKTEERKVPLEISLIGDKELLYSSTSEDDGRGYAAAALPFQAYGALGMARSEFEADSASSQFFWLLFESDLTPAGKNMLDGRYSCFGYTVEGSELLKDVKEGDIIKSAKVVSGLNNLQ